MVKILRSKWILLIALTLGVVSGLVHLPQLTLMANWLASIFVNLLKLMSLPLVFLSIVTTALKFENVDTFRTLGKQVLKYTLLTTTIAAAVALLLYLAIKPASVVIEAQAVAEAGKASYLDYLAQIMPSNIIEPFLEGNVISVLLLAALFSFGALSLKPDQKKPLKQIFDSLYAIVLKIVSGIIVWLPLGLWAFVTLFVQELKDTQEIQSLILYLVCIVSANLIQAVLVLPALLKMHQISPLKLFKDMMPALGVAFFSKSSSAALPVALSQAKKEAGISEEVAHFSLPLCTTINMNACAAFILITVLFVSMVSGFSFNPLELVAWVFIATIAAIGNASVPMGCYFLATSLLAAIGVPVHLMAIILPVYSLIDMLESAINVWSDSCVTAIVDKTYVEAPSEQSASDALLAGE